MKTASIESVLKAYGVKLDSNGRPVRSEFILKTGETVIHKPLDSKLESAFRFAFEPKRNNNGGIDLPNTMFHTRVHAVLTRLCAGLTKQQIESSVITLHYTEQSITVYGVAALSSLVEIDRLNEQLLDTVSRFVDSRLIAGTIRPQTKPGTQTQKIDSVADILAGLTESKPTRTRKPKTESIPAESTPE